ncbi:hypothetical protein QCA50_014829 [Cerrena zonata]|uniref:F-box domain-containing protein n=1 Tax=Cerrena zonata TaxID=2478898 RepID=A0AAW0FY62_9APHY
MSENDRLPTELVSLIAGQFWNSPSSVKAFSLTCHSWYTTSRPHIYHYIVLKSGTDLDVLLSLLRSETERLNQIRFWIKKLRITVNRFYENSKEILFWVPRASTALPPLLTTVLGLIQYKNSPSHTSKYRSRYYRQWCVLTRISQLFDCCHSMSLIHPIETWPWWAKSTTTKDSISRVLTRYKSRVSLFVDSNYEDCPNTRSRGRDLRLLRSKNLRKTDTKAHDVFQVYAR